MISEECIAYSSSEGRSMDSIEGLFFAWDKLNKSFIWKYRCKKSNHEINEKFQDVEALITYFINLEQTKTEKKSEHIRRKYSTLMPLAIPKEITYLLTGLCPQAVGHWAFRLGPFDDFMDVLSIPNNSSSGCIFESLLWFGILSLPSLLSCRVNEVWIGYDGNIISSVRASSTSRELESDVWPPETWNFSPLSNLEKKFIDKQTKHDKKSKDKEP